jgi:hypothetical protein
VRASARTTVITRGGGYLYKGKDGCYGKGGMHTDETRGCTTDDLMKDCPKNQAKVQQEEGEAPEILFIGNVQGGEDKKEWKQVKPQTTHVRVDSPSIVHMCAPLSTDGTAA